MNAKSVLLVAAALYAGGPADFKTRAVFDLVNHQEGVVKMGASRIVAESVFVTHSGKVLGYPDGLEVQFYTKPITDAARIDILENHARQMRNGDFADFILPLDAANAVAQANLTFVVPGTTVGRTVAWKPAELQKYFSDCHFDGKRLRLRSKGAFSEVNARKESLSLSWDVDIDAPVFEPVKK